ncbi:interleukin-12 receptor subunit beta-2 isoform X1 [Falco peregrinus]|uniref:interleukin-12 receptor subunit beta-2 isoform X1 n=1 Tax=Falco peregrinus TaxID=8954 RepID=UPI00247AD70D|nr:interleukin-12 receptor subunit beta-2 isoform X1 [Falco peregrinus]
MLLAWIVPAAIWLLVHFTAEACSKGNVTAGKLPVGAAEICDKGTMTANTAPHVQPGTSITLVCQLRPLPYPEQCRIAIFFNGSELIRNYSSSVSTRFPVHTYGKHMFTCKIVCEYKKKLICGIDIESGNPPDEPRNVSCIQYGTDGHPTCTWDKGRLTYINTTYVVQLSNGTDVLCVSEKSLNKKFGSLALSKLNFDCTYTVVVAASNELGSAFSQPLVFMLIDIVKPHPPNFLVEFENSSVTNCTFFWHGEAQARHCRLRYRPLTRHTWSMVESLNCSLSEKCSLHGLEPHTAYEFQVSCKIHPKRGLWSNWRTYQTWTPEAVPTGILDVWYRQQDMDSQQQNISLFWKALGKAEARGRILQYTVTFEALGQQNLAAEAHHTTQTSYARVTPRVGYKITVTAENSRGRSPPASIMTEPGTQDLPPPQKVTAVAMGNSSILVSWEPPIKSTASISGYVVEWAAAQRSWRLEPPPAWVKLPAANRSARIAEHIKNNVCYQISIFALYRDGAGQVASVRGYSRAEAPSAGPQMYATPQANGVLVSWEDIPAHHQRGCITGYHIYLQKKDGQAAPDVYTISNVTAQRWWYLADLQPGELYTLGMTASTAAGEGPWGNSELVCLESAGGWLTVVLTCGIFIFSACICSVPPARKALHSLLSTLMPQWQSKAIPDPANATWAKNYVSTKGELGLPCSLPLHSASGFEEPEITQVEEAFTKPGHRDKLLLGSTGGSGSGQETEYQPLPSTADGEVYEQQLPDLYKRIVVEAMEHTETGPEYIANPVANTDAAYLPPVTGTTKDLPELECDPLPVFPTTFLTPIASYEGNVTLATVKISCSSFTR